MGRETSTARPPTKPKLPPDQPARQQIAEQLQRTLLVEAAAGTGKTTSMVERMVALVRTGVARLDHMAAVTFTRKAAAELRGRFQIELERAASAATGEEGRRLSEAVERVERCFVGTIHSFCGRLLRERPIEAGIDLAFEEMEDAEDAQLRATAWSDYVDGLHAEEHGVLAELRELGLEINQLRAGYMRYVDYPDVDEWPSPNVEMGDLAEATRDLEEYVQHMEALAATFPNDRGTDKLMDAYEHVCRLVRNRDLTRPAELMEVLEVIKPSTKATQKCWPGGAKQGKAERDRWVAFAEEVAQPLVTRWRERRYSTVIRVLADAAAVYEERRTAAGRLNYQDLLIGASRLLRDKPAIRRYFRRRFTHLLVDEFQDTDPVQAEVMMYLTADDPDEPNWRKCRPVPGSLFVVGDPKQSIYRFRRADIVTYEEVKNIIEASGGAVVSLTANFRTLEQLVSWNNDVFDATFPASENAYSPAARAMHVGRDGDTLGDLAGIRVIEIPQEYSRKEEAIRYDASFIARTIRHALDTGLTVPRSRREIERGVSPTVTPGDFMIVTWGKKQLAEYARPLQELGIPHQVTGGSALAQVSELGLLAECLRAVSEPENPVALVAVLRGELFGMSDADLYAFKKAGGRFNYRSPLPGALDDNVARRFEDAFSRLRRYALWLRRMPPVAAIERISGDLGLPMRALTEPGGNVLAGSMAKSLEMLRAADADLHLVSDMATLLADLIEQNAEFDGLPARPHAVPVVRLMNLHKVKGLEAPIVFLANPSGNWNPEPELHIDRSAQEVRGYLAVHAETSGFHAPLLACPGDWQVHADEEARFRDAENQRLLYVAATRAGTQLVVTQKHKQDKRNPWDFFAPHLADCKPLEDPGPQAAPSGTELTVTAGDVAQAIDEVTSRGEACAAPTYVTAAAKEISLAPSSLHAGSTSGEHGTEWGTVIHFLLEMAMVESGADLRSLARAALEEQGLGASRADEAVETVTSVMQSKIWQRATASPRRLVEVPFEHCVPASAAKEGLPTIIRGVIDLAFREDQGWVIVDYKTDTAAADGLDSLVDHYRPQVRTYAQTWQEIVGEPVQEAGLYFTRVQEYVTLE